MAINIFKRIKSIDIYGSKITLSHNGSTTFKTFFGGILTLITAWFLVYYIYLIIENPKRLSTSVDSSSGKEFYIAEWYFCKFTHKKFIFALIY